MSKFTGRLVALVVALGCIGIGHCDTTEAPATPLHCDQATDARSGTGRSFIGRVLNNDYAFAVTIPNQLTAWDGAAQDAPFHGFVLFLDPQLQACIVFEVHIRVDSQDAPRHAQSASQMRLGEAVAWRERNTDGKLANIKTTFSFRQVDQIDDGEILLITPESNRLKAESIYDALFRSLTFSGRLGAEGEAAHR